MSDQDKSIMTPDDTPGEWSARPSLAELPPLARLINVLVERKGERRFLSTSEVVDMKVKKTSGSFADCLRGALLSTARTAGAKGLDFYAIEVDGGIYLWAALREETEGWDKIVR